MDTTKSAHPPRLIPPPDTRKVTPQSGQRWRTVGCDIRSLASTQSCGTTWRPQLWHSIRSSIAISESSEKSALMTQRFASAIFCRWRF